MEEIRFGDLYSIPTSNGVSRPSAVRGKGFHMINMGELFAHDIINEMPMERVELSAKEQHKFLVQKDDLLFARQSLVAAGAGKCSIVNNIEEPTTFESHLIRVRLDSGRCCPRFYFYLFHLPYNPVKTIVNQCAQAGIRGTELKKIKVPFPVLPIQNKIASILSSYDDLIEKNNRKIAILREMAEEIYKEWFVRRKANQWPIVKMREFGYQAESGKRPKGGIDDSLSEGVPSLGAEVIDKLGMFDFSNVKLVPEEFYQSMKKGIGKDKDILLYKDGAYIGKVTLFMDNFPYEKYAVNEHVFLIRANNKLYQYYLYFTLNQQQYFTQMQNLNRNAAQPGLTPSDIDIVKLCKPDEEIIKKFNRVVEPMLHSIFTIAKQNNILKTQRDLLLPRLMSGKLEVKA